ncbi:MAG: CHAD domain-containing protein [Syntrophomonadaceae bacterium]|nr:CHAD domain-containing protein [Syntrophomonadaceae bacterium]
MTIKPSCQLVLKCVDPQHLECIVTDPLVLAMKTDAPSGPTTLSLDYFDTSDHRLYLNQITYELRQTDVSTIVRVIDRCKKHSLGECLQEWETGSQQAQPQLEAFLPSPLGARLLEIAGSEALQPIIRARGLRTYMELSAPSGSTVMLYADRGLLTSEDQSENIAEICLDLVSGTVEDLWNVGSIIAGRYPLIIETSTLYQRGTTLAGLESSRKKRSYPKVNPKKTLGREIQRILSFCFDEIIKAQKGLLTQPQDSEAVHQLRVKIRQLRSFLYFIKPLLPIDGYEKLQHDLSEWAKIFSNLREIDSMLETWQDLADSYPSLIDNSSELKRILQTERQPQLELLLAPTPEMIGTQVLLNTWNWLQHSILPDNPEFKIPAAAYIKLRLKKVLKRFNKSVQATDFNDSSSLHALRIRSKKLRYVLALLEQVLNKDQLTILASLKELQLNLGQVCDGPRNLTIMEELRAKYGGEDFAYEAGLFIGFETCKSGMLLNEIKEYKVR